MGEALRTALDAVADFEAITGAEILRLRRAVYDDGVIDADEARRLLDIHRNGARGECDVVWADFFVEAIADFFALEREVPDHGVDYEPDYGRAFAVVARAAAPIPAWREHHPNFAWSDGPRAAVREDEADALMDAFRKQGGMALDRIEIRLLARIFDRAVEVPGKLKAFAVVALITTVTADERIDAEEVTFLRRVLYGPAGEDGLAISRNEADALFAIRDVAAERAPEWRDLFVKAVTMYLLFAGSTPERVDSAEAAWLANKLGPAEHWDEEAHALIAYVAREAEHLHPTAQALIEAAHPKAA